MFENNCVKVMSRSQAIRYCIEDHEKESADRPE